MNENEKIDYSKDFEGLSAFIVEEINKINSLSKNGNKVIKGVLTSVNLDLQIRSFIASSKLKGNINQQGFDDYTKHIKRSFIHDVWSVTENRIREITEENKLLCKSRNEKVRELIEEAIGIIKSEKAKKILSKAENRLSGNFVEFDTVLQSVLKSKLLKKEEIKEWTKFFEIFRKIRNATHDNFIAQKTESLECKFYKKDFTQNISVSFLCEDMKRIVEILLNFFEIIEN